MNVPAAMNEVMRSISDLLVFPIDVGYMLYSLHVSMEGRCTCQRCSSAIPKAPSTETGHRPCFRSEMVVRPFPMRVQQANFFGYLYILWLFIVVCVYF